MSCALLLALIPSGNLLWFCLFVLTFFLKINLGAELLFLALFALSAYALKAEYWRDVH